MQFPVPPLFRPTEVITEARFHEHANLPARRDWAGDWQESLLRLGFNLCGSFVQLLRFTLGNACDSQMLGAVRSQSGVKSFFDHRPVRRHRLSTRPAPTSSPTRTQGSSRGSLHRAHASIEFSGTFRALLQQSLAREQQRVGAGVGGTGSSMHSRTALGRWGSMGGRHREQHALMQSVIHCPGSGVGATATCSVLLGEGAGAGGWEHEWHAFSPALLVSPT